MLYENSLNNSILQPEHIELIRKYYGFERGVWKKLILQLVKIMILLMKRLIIQFLNSNFLIIIIFFISFLYF